MIGYNVVADYVISMTSFVILPGNYIKFYHGRYKKIKSEYITPQNCKKCIFYDTMDSYFYLILTTSVAVKLNITTRKYVKYCHPNKNVTWK